MNRIDFLIEHLEKKADAMNRAYERGEIDLKSQDKQIAFSEKLRSLEPRQSNNMGILSSSSIGGGMEGSVQFGAMRGKGLGIRKEFLDYKSLNNKHRTKTIASRVNVMKSMPEIYPEVYGYKQNKSNPALGHMDMEFIPGTTADRVSKLEAARASRDVINAHIEKGYGQASNMLFNPTTGIGVMDARGGNIVLDARDGKPKLVDPLVFKPLKDKGWHKIMKDSVGYLKSITDNGNNMTVLKDNAPGTYIPKSLMEAPITKDTGATASQTLLNKLDFRKASIKGKGIVRGLMAHCKF